MSFTGQGNYTEIEEEIEVTFRNQKFTIKHRCYCNEKGEKFTTNRQDDDMMWAIFRAYWEHKGFEHFYDIDGYREEQEPTTPCNDCPGNDLPGTCASIDSLGRCPQEYNKMGSTDDDIDNAVNDWCDKNSQNVYWRIIQGPAFVAGAERQKEQIMKDAQQLKAQAEKRYDEIGKSGYIQPNQPLAKGTDNIVTIEYANNHNKEHAANLGYYNGVIRTCEKILGVLKEPTKKNEI